MAASLKDLRSRIKSIKNTQQITKAMKLVSAAKFGRAQSNVINSRYYSQAIIKLAKRLANLVVGGSDFTLLNKSSSKNAIVVVVSSERGLCGGYNANVTRAASKIISEIESEGYKVFAVCLGKKSFQSIFRKRKIEEKIKNDPIHINMNDEDYSVKIKSILNSDGLASITTHFDKLTQEFSKKLCHSVCDLYSQNQIGRFVVVYNKFYSAMSQVPVAETILPLSFESNERLEEPVFEPDLDTIVPAVVRRYVDYRFFQILLESIASEHGARMTAMDSATRNGKDMEKKLQITYQRARQAAITKELIEIISGAEAL